MKKSILIVLAIVGLHGAQVQGSSQAAAFGAKAWSFFNTQATPIALTGLAGAIYSSASTVSEKLNEFKSSVESVKTSVEPVQVIATAAVLTAREGVALVQNIAQHSNLLEKQTPNFWFGNYGLDGSLWYRAKQLNAGIISTTAMIQTYFGIIQLLNHIRQSAQPQATGPTQEQIDAYVAAQVAAKMAAVHQNNPSPAAYRGGNRRSGIRARA